MLVEELLTSEFLREELFYGERTSQWNGREMKILKEETNLFSIWKCAKESSSQAGASASTDIDTKGSSSATVEGHYEHKSSDDKGNSESVKVQGSVSVNDKGETNASAKVSYDVKF